MNRALSEPRIRRAAYAGMGLLALAAGVLGSWPKLFASTGIPHSYCYTYDPTLIGIHLVSDALIGLAYFSIPFALLYFARRRTDLPFPWIFLLFAVFIVACGATHWMEVWTLWNPQYWLSGAIKMLTAAASVPTAIALVYLIPHALRIPAASELVSTKDALEREVAERRKAEVELRAARDELESQVAERTAALERANRDLSEERLFLQTVLDNTPAIIHVKDESGRLLLVNRRYAQIAGRPVEDLVGRTVSEVLSGPDVPDIVEHDRAVLAGNEQQEREETLLLPDGLHTYLSIKVPAEGVGFPGRVLCAFRVDITERKRAEEALRSEDERKNRFLAVLSHELRNPLNPVRASLAILKREDADPGLIRMAREIIERQVSQMGRLLDDLLDIARITGDRLELRRSLVPLAGVLRMAVETSQPLIDSRKHVLSTEPASADVMLDADPTRLAQVFSNLLNNAAKYTPSGGWIRLTVQRISTGVEIVVSDNGSGIDPHHIPALFEMFASQGAQGDQQTAGLGLGLYIVRVIVGLHGGTVTAHSAGRGKGASFRVVLPVAADARPADAGERQSAPVSSRRRRVVVIDDNVDAAQSLATLLRLDGHEVGMAHDGGAALEEMARRRPDLAILDIGLPGMDGYALARAIRASEWGRGVTLVALTGWGQAGDKRRALAAGFDHHLTKPVEIEALMAILDGLDRGANGESPT